jgi:hypothetical protein
MSQLGQPRRPYDASPRSVLAPGFGHRLKQMDVADVPGPTVSRCEIIAVF